MVISRQHLDEMIEHAQAEAPNEACGLLAVKEGRVVQVYCLESSKPSPITYYMDPQKQLQAMMDIDEQGWEMGAIFHSHPATPAYPSPTDVALAFYPDALYVIISLASSSAPEIRAFHISSGAIEEQGLEVEE